MHKGRRSFGLGNQKSNDTSKSWTGCPEVEFVGVVGAVVILMGPHAWLVSRESHVNSAGCVCRTAERTGVPIALAVCPRRRREVVRAQAWG